MKVVKVNDELGHRGRGNKLLVVTPTLITLFTGKGMPGMFRVLGENFTKNGKWSHSTWEVECNEGISIIKFVQDFGSGEWINAHCWKSAVIEFRGKIHSSDHDESVVIRAIRAIFPKTAERLDLEELQASQDPASIIKELIAAQEALALAQQQESAVKARLLQLEEAERIQVEAKETQERVSKASSLLKSGKKISLADLKAAMG